MDEAAKGITNAATAQEAAEAAQKTADQAKKIAESIDLTPYVTKTELAETAEAAKTEITNALANYLTADAIEKKLEALKQEVADANEEQLEEMQTKVKNAVEGVNSIWSAVTNVSLYGATTAGGTLSPFATSPINMTFTKSVISSSAARFTRIKTALPSGTATTQKDGLFGDPDKKDFYNTTAGSFAAYSATEGVSYTDKAVVKFPTQLIVRVSPTNADLTNADITLVDGEGVALDQVEVESVKPYTQLMTRAGSASGLWVINLNVIDKADNKSMNRATLLGNAGAGTKEGKRYDGDALTTADPNYDQILYAVKINNTADVEAAAERGIVSEYGLTIKELEPIKPYVGVFNNKESLTAGGVPVPAHADLLTTGKVNDALLYTIGARTVPSESGVTIKNGKWNDLLWNVELSTDKAAAYANDGFYRRHNIGAVRINNGGTISVDLTGVKNAQGCTPQYYYVARDDANAGGSDASELNAWKSYAYGENLGKMFKCSEKCEFTITIPETSETGDYIGFRIFAVNYDGTLVDPDGTPFEVWVGANKKAQAITENFIPTVQSDETFTYAFVPTVTTGNFVQSGQIDFKNGDTRYHADAAYSASTTTTPATGRWKWELLQADKTAATKWSEVALVRFTSTDVIQWKDGETATGVISFTDSHGDVVNTIDVALTKVLPTAFGKATWKTSQPGDPQNTNKYIAYVYASNAGVLSTTQPFTTTTAFATAWNAAATKGYKNMVQAMNDLDANYIFVIENILKDDDNNYTLPASFKNTAAGPQYDVAVDPALVDGTEHNAKWYYCYNNVSSVNSAKEAITGNKTKDNNVYIEGTPFTIAFACPLDPAVMVYSWDTEARNVPAATWGGAAGAPTTPVNAKITDVYVLYSNPAGGIFADIEYTDAAGKKFTATNYQLGNATPDYLVYQNSFDNEPFKRTDYTAPVTNYRFKGANYVAKGTGILTTAWTNDFKVTITSDSNNKEEYFKGCYMTTGTLTLTKNSESTNPTTAVQSTFKVQAVDAFGHVKTIISLPIKVKNT